MVPIDSYVKNNSITRLRWILLSVLYICVLSLVSCASVQPQRDVVAFVDNDPITVGDIEYSLQIAHRRENLSGSKNINISEFVSKVIDERLLVHEARRMNLDRSPELVEKVDAFILRESVSRLYDEEVLSHVQVSDDEIQSYYQREYEQYILRSAEAKTPEEAKVILEAITEGPDVDNLSQGNESHALQMFRVEKTYSRKDLNESILAVIDGLDPGETSDVFEAGHRYYIVHLVDRRDAPELDMESMKEEVMSAIRKVKVKKRSEEYLNYLISKMKPEINRDLLESIPLNRSPKEHTDLLQDRRVLVKLRDSELTVGEFVGMLRSGKESSKEITVKQWIDYRLVDYEALDRNYHVHTDLKDRVSRYKNKLLMNMFIKNELVSEITISEDELNEYYHDNQEDFHYPVKYRLQQITLKTAAEAEQVRASLMKGADFSWIAKNKSHDNYAPVGGMVGWRTEEQFPAELNETAQDLEPGMITDVMKSGDFFRIYRIQEKTDTKVKEFEQVKPEVRRQVFGVKYNQAYESFLSRLKSEADIVINKEAVNNLDRLINNSMS